MTLQEKAFMIDLIKRNYRRRVAYELIIMGALTISILIYDLTDGTVSSTFGLITLALLLLLFIFIIFTKRAPAKKREQLKALREQYDAKADFEELLRCVPLKEYFEI